MSVLFGSLRSLGKKIFYEFSFRKSVSNLRTVQQTKCAEWNSKKMKWNKFFVLNNFSFPDFNEKSSFDIYIVFVLNFAAGFNYHI